MRTSSRSLVHGAKRLSRVPVRGHRCGNPWCKRIGEGHMVTSCTQEGGTHTFARVDRCSAGQVQRGATRSFSLPVDAAAGCAPGCPPATRPGRWPSDRAKCGEADRRRRRGSREGRGSGPGATGSPAYPVRTLTCQTFQTALTSSTTLTRGTKGDETMSNVDARIHNGRDSGARTMTESTSAGQRWPKRRSGASTT